MGQGVSATTGTGVARQLRPDMKEAVFYVLELGVAAKAAGAAGKAIVKKATKKPAKAEVNNGN
jgi:hypothetical protein